MTMGPVQLLVVGFEGGELKANPRRARAPARRRRRAADRPAFVRKDDYGNIEKIQRSDLSQEEAEAFGATVGALIGFGAAGDEPRRRRRSRRARGRSRIRRGRLVRRRRDPERRRCRGCAARAPLGDPAARRHPPCRRLSSRRCLDPPRRSRRDRGRRRRGGGAAAEHHLTRGAAPPSRRSRARSPGSRPPGASARQGAHQAADVVPHRLDRDPERLRDVLRRVTAAT